MIAPVATEAASDLNSGMGGCLFSGPVANKFNHHRNYRDEDYPEYGKLEVLFNEGDITKKVAKKDE